MPEQVSVEVPGVPRVTLVGDNVQDRPTAGNTEELRFTVPAPPLTDAIVIVGVTVDPASVVKLFGLALIEKSGTAMLYVTVVV